MDRGSLDWFATLIRNVSIATSDAITFLLTPKSQRASQPLVVWTIVANEHLRLLYLNWTFAACTTANPASVRDSTPLYRCS